MQHPTEAAQPISRIPMQKPAAWVLRGDARTIERARRSKRSIHARRD